MLVTMALYLEMMAVEGEKLSTLVKRLPRYHIVKDSLVCPAYRLHTLVAEVKKLYKGLEINQLDGLRLENPAASELFPNPFGATRMIGLLG